MRTCPRDPPPALDYSCSHTVLVYIDSVPVLQLAMERELASMRELSLVVLPDHETIEFKFLLKPKNTETPCITEEWPKRLLTRGMLEGDVRLANFRLNGDDQLLEYK